MPIELDLNKEVKLDLSKGIALDLDKKGVFLDLTKTEGIGKHLRLGLGWNCKMITQGLFYKRQVPKDVDIDLVILMRNAAGKKVGAVFFGKKKAPGIRLDKDDRQGSVQTFDINARCASLSKDNENVFIELDKIDPSVTQLDVLAVIYNNKEFRFKDIDAAYCKLVDEDNRKVLCYSQMLNDGGNSISLHTVSLKKVNGSWVFTPINEYSMNNIAQVVQG